MGGESRSWVRVRVVGKGSSKSRREEIPLEMGRFWKRASWEMESSGGGKHGTEWQRLT